MEPSGRNPWQPVAIAKARNGGSKPKTVAVGCDRLREKAHGKEGVVGSSPTEGFPKVPAHRPVLFAVWTMNRTLDVHQTSTKRGADQSGALCTAFLTASRLPVSTSTERPRGCCDVVCRK